MRYDFDIEKHIEDKNTKVFIPAGINKNTVAIKYLMQSTGLRDVNGIEIYEGDFLSDADDIWEVIFDEGSFVVVQQDVCLLLSEVCNDVSVVGNVYENPEMREE
jgi:YopX protein.